MAAPIDYGSRVPSAKPSSGAFAKRSELTAVQQEFIVWLLDPSRDKGTQVQWARDHHIDPSTLTRWKQHDKLFRDEWQRQADAVNGGIERVQRVVDALYERAMGGSEKAIQLYLEYVKQFTPKQALVIEDRTVRDMSDADLAAALKETAAALSGGKESDG